jgi:hypothetical protein
MRSPYTYTCPCGSVHTVPITQTGWRRLWGTTTYAPAFEHTCLECERKNYVHDGVVTLSIPQKTSSKEEAP